MKEALYYEQLENMKVQCHLCPNECVILPGKRGSCRVRENRAGKLYTLVYGLPCATGVDPIEKKPLFHFLPGSKTYSIATPGCNLHCKFCQNWEISQRGPDEVKCFNMDPKAVVDAALKEGCESIAYTYVEPAIFYEYMLDIAKLAHKAGLKNVMVTNGYLNPSPARRLFGYIDALNIDLKGFSEEYYRDICAGKLEPILKTIQLAQKMGVWLELTTLIVPGFNDSDKMLKEEFEWIVSTLGTRVPVHLSRFFPHYKMQHLPPTPEETMKRAYRLAKDASIDYAYLGNISMDDTESTFCPKCDKKIIDRGAMYRLGRVDITGGRCSHCRAKIDGIFEVKK